MNIEEILTQSLQQMTTLNDKIELLATNHDGKSYAPASAPMIGRGLPEIADMANLELTFFDNEVGRSGKSRFNLKAEVNTGKKAFRDARDFVEYADLHNLANFSIKLRKRKISEAYRERLEELIRQSIVECAPIFIGMFNVKGGGVKGQIWLEDQYIMVVHDGDYRPIGGVLHINGCEQQFQMLDYHPKTKIAFKPGPIKAKAICYPKKELSE